MAYKLFRDHEDLICSDWLNPVSKTIYDILGDKDDTAPDTKLEAVRNLGAVEEPVDDTRMYARSYGRWVRLPSDMTQITDHQVLTNRDAPTAHPVSAIDGLSNVLATKAPLSHTHTQTEVTDLSSALAGKSAIDHNHDAAYVNVTGDTMTGGLVIAGSDIRVNNGGVSVVRGTDNFMAVNQDPATVWGVLHPGQVDFIRAGNSRSSFGQWNSDIPGDPSVGFVWNTANWSQGAVTMNYKHGLAIHISGQSNALRHDPWWQGSDKAGFSLAGLYNTGTAANLCAIWVPEWNAYSIQIVGSSIEIKESVVDLPVGLDALLKLRPVQYRRKNIVGRPELRDETDYYGFIGEEVEAAGLPNLVTYQEGVVQSVQYDRVSVLLTKAVQELTQQVATLTARIAALEASHGA